jgi:Flp pilus assembly pilin Flp
MMRICRRICQRICQDGRGATAIEYGMIAGVVSIVILASLQVIGKSVLQNMFQQVANAL